MWPAVIALLYIAGLCLIAVFHKAYRDNILQQWGLVAAFFGCLGLVSHVIEFSYITGPCGLLLVGMVAFATGTLGKVMHFSRRRNDKTVRLLDGARQEPPIRPEHSGTFKR
jgi:hypothetical protein